MPHLTGIDDALLDADLDVVVYPGWTTRGASSFNPKGLVVHHTGPGSTSGLVNLCINGRSDLPGPLCHVVLDPAGICHVIAAGRANHAGAGGWNGLAGNSSVLGIEAVHSGSKTQAWPQCQLEAYVVASAALLRLIGRDERHLCAHREWAPNRKIDPTGIDMNRFRGAVRGELAVLADTGQRLIERVPPMFDPPLGPFAAAWFDDNRRVISAVTPEGAVYFGIWYGNVAGKAYWGQRRAALIGARPDGQPGYRITATSGEHYDLPDGYDQL